MVTVKLPFFLFIEKLLNLQILVVWFIVSKEFLMTPKASLTELSFCWKKYWMWIGNCWTTEGECVKREECQYSTSLSLIENHFQERQDKRRPYSPHFGIPKSFWRTLIKGAWSWEEKREGEYRDDVQMKWKWWLLLEIGKQISILFWFIRFWLKLYLPLQKLALLCNFLKRLALLLSKNFALVFF